MAGLGQVGRGREGPMVERECIAGRLRATCGLEVGTSEG